MVIAAIRAADYFLYGRVVHGISRAIPGGEGEAVLFQAVFIGVSGVAMIWVGIRNGNRRAKPDRGTASESRSDSNVGLLGGDRPRTREPKNSE